MRNSITARDTRHISLTIYNGGFGSVNEHRTIDIKQGQTEIIYADVAKKIEIDSLLVTGLNVCEFNYDFDLVGRDRLLMKYIDRDVILKDRETGKEKFCRLLSVEEGAGCVLEDNDTGEIYLDTKSEIILPSLPSGLIVKPALVWKTDGEWNDFVNVSYLSRGFSWKANYVIELMPLDLNITGWAEIENTSGMTYENAKIKLIAGDVKRVDKEEDFYDDARYMVVHSSAPELMKEKTFFDYHMYTAGENITLKDNQSKQIKIIERAEIPYIRYYHLNLENGDTDIIIEFENSEEANFGYPVPAGKVKFYKHNEEDYSLEFIGEDEINHTAKDETVVLSLGKAFDIVFEYNAIDRQKVGGFEHYVCECIIRNHKTEEAEIRFEPFLYGMWEMIASSHKFTKISSSQIQFAIKIPAGFEEAVSFSYRVDRRMEIFINK